MNNQQIFDKVCERLRDGTGMAIDSNGDCVYLNRDNGLKCAIGIFIKDGHEAQELAGDIYDLLSHYNLKEVFGFELEGEISETLLDKLQRIHDVEYSWADKEFINEKALENIAKAFNLTYTPPT